jgi:hypothetical protein
VWDFTMYFILSHILTAVDSQTWNLVSWKMVLLDMSTFQYSGNEVYALGFLNLQFQDCMGQKNASNWNDLMNRKEPCDDLWILHL